MGCSGKCGAWGGAGGPPSQPCNAARRCQLTPELLLQGFLAGIPMHGLECTQVFGKPLPIPLSSKFDPPQAAASVVYHCATKCASMNNSPQLWTDFHACTTSPTRMSAPKMVWDIVALTGDGWQTFSPLSAHQRGCCSCAHRCFFRRISMYPIT